MQTTNVNWSDLFLCLSFDAKDILPASKCLSDLAEFRSTGAMFDAYGPFRNHDEAALAILGDDMSEAGMSVEEVDWTGFDEAGGLGPESGL